MVVFPSTMIDVKTQTLLLRKVAASSAIAFALVAALSVLMPVSGGETPADPALPGAVEKPAFYGFTLKSLSGQDIDFSQYQGKVVLVVNTASKCGFTSQYAGLEALYKKYAPRGLVVLGFPCNQFGGQEPGDGAEIATFCQANYGVTFPMFEKIDVNGKEASPLYVFLKQAAPNDHSNIKWNFTKFLIASNGGVLRRYGSMASPESLEKDIEKALEANQSAEP